jgi:hypothetical protein
MKIRPDFAEVEPQLSRLVLYSQQAHKYNVTDWSHQMNQEDFGRIYELDSKRKAAFEKLYCNGRDCAIWMSSQFQAFLEVGDYPTLKSYIESFEDLSFMEPDEMSEFLAEVKELAKASDTPWAVSQMIYLYDRQIEMVRSSILLLEELRESTLYKRESGIKISELDQIMSKNNITFNNASNVQIGDHNKQVITQTLNSIIEKIDQSDAKPEEKDEAKSKLKDFITNPIVVSILGGAVSGLVGLTAGG